MLLGTYQALQKIPSPQIHINNEPLRQVSVAKYLGMYIDESLHWDHHIDTLVKKISSKIGILRSLRNILNWYPQAHVQCHCPPPLRFFWCLYDAASETNKSRLQRLQTRAARLISGTGSRDSRNPVFKELGWLSLENGRLVHKCNYGFYPTAIFGRWDMSVPLFIQFLLAYIHDWHQTITAYLLCLVLVPLTLLLWLFNLWPWRGDLYLDFAC